MIKKSLFGQLNDGREVFLFMLANKHGIKINIINYGAILTNLFVADRNSKIDDIVLGYDSLEGYLNDKAFIGSIVGRYGNRIAKGKFKINGKEYNLNLNDGKNHLHGGIKGFNKFLWDAEPVEGISENSVRLTCLSPDGDEGYPGNVKLEVTYTLNNENELGIKYEGTTDKTTVLNPTHHSYFNLSGNFNNTIIDHKIQIDADAFLPVDNGQIPIGRIEKVDNTPMDFRNSIPVGLHLTDKFEQLEYGNGYDHNWVLNNFNGEVRKVAAVLEPSSGRFMEVFTDQPGIQFYSGNSLDENVTGKKGKKLKFRSGLCLEAQFFPDSPNQPSFPSTILNPGEIYRQKTIYKFSVK